MADTRKALTGQYHGLLNPEVMAAKAKLEKYVRDPIEKDPAKNKEYGEPWKKIDDTLTTQGFSLLKGHGGWGYKNELHKEYERLWNEPDFRNDQLRKASIEFEAPFWPDRTGRGVRQPALQVCCVTWSA